MIEKSISNFDIRQICDSGQCFRMSQVDENTLQVIAGDRMVRVSQQGERCIFHCQAEEFEEFWKWYFDLEEDYGIYIQRINPRDCYLTEAARFGSGIRILRQDLWEMIVTFLISQQNNIGRIRRCVQSICECYGEKKIGEGGEIYYAFPKPEVLAELGEEELKACNLGYRSKYVVRSARSVVNGEFPLERILEMSYPKAREELLKLFGVGGKVADCICLFALHQLDAFPVDTHMNQAISCHYKRGFPNRRYRGCRGEMQQYIFYYELRGSN